RWQALELLAEHHPAWIHEHSSAAQHVTLKDWLLTLFWNGCESWVVPDNSDLPRLLALFQHPWHMEWAVRKLVTLQGMSALEAWAVTLKNKDCRLAFLQGLEKALENSSATYTPTWQSLLNTLVRQDASLLSPVQEIAAQLGDLQAQQALRERLASMTLTTEEQTRYLTILTRKSNQDLLPILLQLFENSSSRRQVIKSLARYDSDEVHSLLIGRYNGLTLDEKQDAIATLVARPRYARALLDALDAKTIPSLDILAPSVVALRQLQAVDIRKRVAERWGGEVTTEAIKERIGKLQNQLTSATLQQANLKKGRTLFDKHCATCHRLFGEGQAIGPELTGAQRSSLDYLLENTVNPNAIVPQDYRATTFVLQNGQVLTGMILSQQGDSLTIQTASEKLTIRKQDIEEQQQTSKSLMPEGLLDSLSLEEIRDLFGYLSSPKQISDK
ncbi:MAG TPA: c-type cytochrome, partial [Gemmatales bacterium]|nr:c-type cytochrome [Gemmatales bacterium]